jgi:hypothetical protein
MKDLSFATGNRVMRSVPSAEPGGRFGTKNAPAHHKFPAAANYSACSREARVLVGEPALWRSLGGALEMSKAS